MVLSSFNVTSDILFQRLPPLLKRTVSDITLIRAARVPLIKFRYKSVSVDIVFASVAMLTPPTPEQMRNNDFLLTVSADNRYNVNGIRTVLEVRHRLKDNYDTFVCTLKAVKRWATQRQVYANLFTYPNGCVLAIMVARVCLFFKHITSPSQLLRLFFSFYARWLAHPGSVTPVFITESIKPQNFTIAGLSSCWDHNKSRCKEELLPILNPAYPYVNAAHNVGRSAFEHFYGELLRGRRLLPLQSSISFEDSFSSLLEPYRITEDYTHFATVHVASVARDEGRCRALFGVWKGLVESRLRMFIYALECCMDVRALPHLFERQGTTPNLRAKPGSRSSDHVVMEGVMFLGVKDRANAASPPDAVVIESCFKEFLRSVEASLDNTANNSTPFRRDTYGMPTPWLTLHHVDDDDCPPELFQYYYSTSARETE